MRTVSVPLLAAKINEKGSRQGGAPTDSSSPDEYCPSSLKSNFCDVHDEDCLPSVSLKVHALRGGQVDGNAGCITHTS